MISICVAGSRLLVEAAIHEEFVTRLAEMARGLRLGGPEVEADMGPLISSRQQQNVLSYIEAGQVYVSHYFSAGFEVSRTPYKASGFGHSEGPDAINEFLTTKTVSINLEG